MRLLVECTYVYDHPHHNSGIQRVVRNIISKLGRHQEIADAIPIILKNNKIYEVRRLSPDSFNMYIANRLHAKLVRVRERYWLYYLRIEERRPFRKWPNLRQGLLVLYKLPSIFLSLFILVIANFCLRAEVGKRIVELAVSPGDVLILLDSSWQSDCYSKVEKLKTQGVAIVSVIYDLIPLTHPRFCSEGLVVVFQRWFKWVTQTADGFMAISKTIRDQAQSYMRQDMAETKPQHQWFDYFHLGSELDLAQKNGLVREQLKKPFQNGCPVYLMVGTIEPRKNHGYLLDVFESLWQKGLGVNLCFVGKVGWKCQSLIERVENHGEHNRRLFMFNDLSDTELEYCYQRSRSLVFPAYVEGFGLPLVEAMQRGLPVMASDIPIFHEVGGDFIAYFDLEKPESLAALIRNFEASGKFPAAKRLEEWSWLNWEDSAQQFLTRIVSHLAEAPAVTKSTSTGAI
jgi:O-antigen biosynthesis alpha-1,2-rhamnosyltransferase